ncbi:hypothetical protein [Streptomyces antibioticus]|uniref:hypothetical protein n=1 Tax=Streptomyces antibioticus TaxID=1890 RepID=UPI003F46CF0A
MPDLTDDELEQLIDAIGLKRPRGGRKFQPIAHGTYRGARQHRYRKERPCDPCRLAENAYQNELKQKARQRKRAREQARQGGTP